MVPRTGRPVARGEGLYWRYERLLKRLEDRVGSVVSASGHLYAVRRSFFTPSTQTAGTDDFLISSQVVRAGGRLAFDEQALVLVATPEEGGTELRRKVRVMNRGLRSAFALGDGLLPTRTGLYAFEVLFHKILRRFVAFFLVAAAGEQRARWPPATRPGGSRWRPSSPSTRSPRPAGCWRARAGAA